LIYGISIFVPGINEISLAGHGINIAFSYSDLNIAFLILHT
jgi:hypothetical protein